MTEKPGYKTRPEKDELAQQTIRSHFRESLPPVMEEMVQNVQRLSPEGMSEDDRETVLLARDAAFFSEEGITKETAEKLAGLAERAIMILGKHVEPAVQDEDMYRGPYKKLYSLSENAGADEKLIAVVCKILQNLGRVSSRAFKEGRRMILGEKGRATVKNPMFEDLELDRKICDLREILPQMIFPMVEKRIGDKFDAYQRDGVPLNLYPEQVFLYFLKGCRGWMNVSDLLSKTEKDVGRYDASLAFETSWSRSRHLEELFERKRFRKIVTEYKGGSEETQKIIDSSRAKVSSTIGFDLQGLPFSDDPSPQFPWVDYRLYRKKFDEIALSEKDRIKAGKIMDHSGRFTRNTVVADQLGVMKRASVAELLRKLINMDMQYGDNHETRSTQVGYYPRDLVENCFFFYPKDLDSVFWKTNVVVDDLFGPLYALLEQQMNSFGAYLLDYFDGRNFEILVPRIKKPASVLMKMLRKGNTKVLDVTDLIGFTVLADKDEQVEKVAAEVNGMMTGNVIVTDMWTKPSATGRKSLDLTGVPRGYDVKMQVQCTTKEYDHRNDFQLSSHEAYKYRMGKDLLDKVNADPDKYLDMLHMALSNLRTAFDVIRQVPNLDTGNLLKCYSVDFSPVLCPVRTLRLY
jgi:hypothetical protein